MYVLGRGYRCEGDTLDEKYNGTFFRESDLKKNIIRFYERKSRASSTPTNVNHENYKNFENVVGHVTEAWVDPDKSLISVMRLNKMHPMYSDLRGRVLESLKPGAPDEKRVGISPEWNTKIVNDGDRRIATDKNIKAMSLVIDAKPVFSEQGAYVIDADNDLEALLKRAFSKTLDLDEGGHATKTSFDKVYVRPALRKQLKGIFAPPTQNSAPPAESAPKDAPEPQPEADVDDKMDVDDETPNAPNEQETPATGNAKVFDQPAGTETVPLAETVPAEQSPEPANSPQEIANPLTPPVAGSTQPLLSASPSDTMSQTSPPPKNDGMDVDDDMSPPAAQPFDASKLTTEQLEAIAKAHGLTKRLRDDNKMDVETSNDAKRARNKPQDSRPAKVPDFDLEGMAGAAGGIGEQLRQLQRLRGFEGNPEQYLSQLIEQQKQKIQASHAEFNKEFRELMINGGYDAEATDELIADMDKNPQNRKMAQLVASAAWRNTLNNNANLQERRFQQAQEQASEMLGFGQMPQQAPQQASVSPSNQRRAQQGNAFSRFGDTDQMALDAIRQRNNWRSSVGNPEDLARQREVEQHMNAQNEKLSEQEQIDLLKQFKDRIPRLGEQLSQNEVNALDEKKNWFSKMREMTIGYDNNNKNYYDIPYDGYIHNAAIALLYDSMQRNEDGSKTADGRVTSGAVMGIPSIKDLQTKTVIGNMNVGADTQMLDGLRELGVIASGNPRYDRLFS